MKKKCLKTQDIKELEKLNNSYLLNPQIDNGEFYKWLINTKDENY